VRSRCCQPVSDPLGCCAAFPVGHFLFGHFPCEDAKEHPFLLALSRFPFTMNTLPPVQNTYSACHWVSFHMSAGSPLV
jgi:hypothetical protein